MHQYPMISKYPKALVVLPIKFSLFIKFNKCKNIENYKEKNNIHILIISNSYWLFTFLSYFFFFLRDQWNITDKAKIRLTANHLPIPPRINHYYDTDITLKIHVLQLSLLTHTHTCHLFHHLFISIGSFGKIYINALMLHISLENWFLH